MRNSAVFAGILVGQLLCAPAFAQSLADRETARSLMDDGDAKRDRGDRAGALKSYEAADALMHVTSTGLEVAKAQVALGMLLEARETLARVQRIPSKPNDSPPLVAAKKAADALSTDLATRLPSLVVNVTGAEPAQITVTIDGETIPSAALAAPRKVNPGAHAVIARAAGMEKREDVTLGERDTRTVSLELRPAAATPPPPPPAHPSALPRALEYGGFGVAIVGIGVGTVTGILSLSKVSDVKNDCTDNHCPPGRQSDIDSAKSLGTVSTIAFIVAGAGAATGVVGLILNRKEASVEPVVGLGLLGARGTF